MPNVIINGKEVQSVEWSNEYVMTTETLAYFFGVSAENVRRNFNRNRDRFIEGKHFFKLEGDELQNFRTICPEVVAPRTPVLYLWTRRGAARHAKMINSDVAWDIFELLEDAYFNRETDNDDPVWQKHFYSPSGNTGAADFDRGVELKKLASHTRNPEIREWLVAEAAKLIIGRHSKSSL